MTQPSLPARRCEPEMLFTYAEVAESMNLTVRSLQRAAAQGELTFVRLGRRTVRIRPKDVHAWLERKSRRWNGWNKEAGGAGDGSDAGDAMPPRDKLQF